MARKSNVFGAIVIFIFAATALAVALPASQQGTAGNVAQPAKKIPAFHAAPPAARLAATMDPKQFSDVAT